VRSTAGPLAGLVVCDLSTVLAGPYCTMLLGDLGADVIKIEPPDGDPTRGWGPPWAGDTEESAYYLSINRNKRSLRLDLHAEGDRDVLTRLIERSDVLVENLRVGALDRLGFGDPELDRLNPRLVHLAITGYGPTGPLADRPGYDFIIQAFSGLMSITGQPDEDGGRPTKVGVAITDLATGMLGAVAVLAALRQRDGAGPHGRGQRIDLSLFESTLAWLANQASNHLVAGTTPERLGNAHPNITPYETFATLDGEICVAVGSERLWGSFCEAVGVPGLAEDTRFATNATRVANRVALRPILEQRFAAASSTDWLDRLAAAGVPSGPINDIAAAFAHPQAAARAMVETVEHPTIGPLPLTGIPFKLGRTPGSIRRPPPLLDEHRDELLRWLDDEPG
jgi:formyl-CoA transferase